MPPKNYKKKAYKKSGLKKKKKVNKDITYVIQPNIGGMPKSLITTLKFHDTKTLNVGAAGIAGVQVYRLNCIRDPDYTGVGNSARGFDQMMLIYDHFYVMASTIRVTYWSKDIVQNNTVGVAFRDDFAAENNAYDYIEQDCVYKLLGGQNSGSSQKTVQRHFRYKPYNGVSYKESENKGDAVNTPTEVTYAHVFAANEFAVDTLGTQCTIDIYYKVMFTEQKDLISS